MSLVFVDTSGWAALENLDDDHHRTAHRLNRKLLRAGARYLTSSYVIDETLTLLQARASHKSAIQFFSRLSSSRLVSVEYIGRAEEQEAFELFQARPDSGFSFTDCTSFVLMRKKKIREALATDRHFTQEGFVALLRTSAR